MSRLLNSLHIDHDANFKETREQLKLLMRPVSAAPAQDVSFSPIADGADAVSNRGGYRYELHEQCSNLRFLHIGKCGGTAIVHHFLQKGVKLNEYHLVRPELNQQHWFFLWVRNPLTRFVSAFNHAKGTIEFDIGQCDKDNLRLDNCPAPRKIQCRIENGYAFDPVYDQLIASFESANALAESLSSSDGALKARAHQLMTSRKEHLYKGIGWHLLNGLFVKKCFRQILFVGRLEHFNADFERLSEQVKFPNPDFGIPGKTRENKQNYSRGLSGQAVENLRRFYRESDYRALDELVKHGLLTSDDLEQYNQYPY